MRIGSIRQIARAAVSHVTVVALVLTLAAPVTADAAVDRGGGPSASPVADVVAAGRAAQDYADDRVLVRFASGVSGTASASRAHARIGAVARKRFSMVDGLESVGLPPGVSVEEAVAAYRSMPEVLYAEPDYIMHSALTPNDSLHGLLWGMHNIGQAIYGVVGTPDADIDAPEAWEISTGSPSVVIAVLDTGVDYSHPDLTSNMWVNAGEIPGNGLDDDLNGYVDDVYGIDTANDDSDPMDDHGHGTHCAGTIGAQGNNSVGVVGVNWDTSIMALKALGSSGSGYTSDIITTLEYAELMGPDIINCSWGGTGTPSLSLEDQMEYMSDTLFVCAAGNGGADGIGDDNDVTPHYPSSFDLPNILAVGASDNRDALGSFSNYGLTSVDVFAPGVSIGSTMAGGYWYMSGTSMAAPHVAGIAGLLLSHKSGISAVGLKSAIMSAVDVKEVFSGRCVTNGRVNARGALLAVSGEAPVAADDSYTTDEDTPKNMGILANDTDADGDPLVPTVVTGVAHGALVGNSDDSFTYTPASDYYGTDSFTYRVNDGIFDSAVATVYITVNPVNDPPSFTKGPDVFAGDGAYSAAWATAVSPGPGETTQTVSFTINPDDPSLFSVPPTVGEAGVLSFTPVAGSNGQTSCSVFLTDSLEATCAAQTFTVTIDTVPPGTPVLSAAALSSTQINLTWPAVSDVVSGLKHYVVYRNGVALPGVVSASATSFTDSGLASGTSYSYRIEAVDNAGNKASSNTATAKTGVAPAPVYRFYNFTNNTHFYTPSSEERDMVIARWPNVYQYEGIAYYTNTANNTQPLYRFYNTSSGSHFYTASDDEANTILSKWPDVFLLDGQTYAVNPGPAASSVPVYRFYNLTNGSHFYTASADERDTVMAKWPNVYSYEGPAFWLGQ
ncbi:MAG: S8 family serine peptidase [Coriobacteriia bacterium]|nr:S8 family serine peptidase [Coriobacteriia bacterium]